jgi:hypothetical protein
MVGLGKHVELLAAVGTVRVAHDPQLLEHVQRPVDRLGRGGRVHLPAALDQFGTGHMAISAREDLDQDAALRCPAETPGMKALAHVRPRSIGRRAVPGGGGRRSCAGGRSGA